MSLRQSAHRIIPGVNASILSRARQLLLTYKRSKELNDIIEDEKVFFRDLADGETLDVPVAGVGNVKVKAASIASRKQVQVFNEDKFNALDDKTKALLFSLGIVEKKVITTGGAAASVSITLNK